MKKLIFCMIAGIMSLIGCGTPEPTGELLSVDYTHSGTMAGYIYEGRVKQIPSSRLSSKRRCTSTRSTTRPEWRSLMAKDGISPQSSPTARAYTPPALMHGLAAMVLAAFKVIS